MQETNATFTPENASGGALNATKGHCGRDAMRSALQGFRSLFHQYLHAIVRCRHAHRSDRIATTIKDRHPHAGNTVFVLPDFHRIAPNPRLSHVAPKGAGVRNGAVGPRFESASQQAVDPVVGHTGGYGLAQRGGMDRMAVTDTRLEPLGAIGFPNIDIDDIALRQHRQIVSRKPATMPSSSTCALLRRL